MEVVYRLGGATGAEVAAHLPDPPSYSAVRAMLSILESKGHLRHETKGNRYVYLPAIGRDRARLEALREVVRTFFQGSPKEAVVSLLDDASRDLSPSDLVELRALIDKAIKQGK